MASSNNPNQWGLTNSGIVWGLAVVILLSIGILAVLRHTFGSIRISAGAES